ncbi:hypothetical protein [Nocardiopsis sp. NPDC006832]|uniref:hypothetical protein n=1 Tax=Nocardiopsis sp. NPDC006832 TaxID=3157188 RepID=UPI0033E69067
MNHGVDLCERLHDHVALDEIELYAEVLTAVADTDQSLSLDEIDRALGIVEHPEGDHGGTPPAGGTPCPEPGREEPDPRAPEPTPPEGASPRGAGIAPAPRPPDPRSERPPADLKRNATLTGTGHGPIPLGPSTPWAPLQALGDFHTHRALQGPLLRRLAPWYI